MTHECLSAKPSNVLFNKSRGRRKQIGFGIFPHLHSHLDFIAMVTKYNALLVPVSSDRIRNHLEGCKRRLRCYGVSFVHSSVGGYDQRVGLGWLVYVKNKPCVIVLEEGVVVVGGSPSASHCDTLTWNGGLGLTVKLTQWLTVTVQITRARPQITGR